MSENNLHLEKSLYLKQHADNPIHWWAYGDQPLRIAKEQNKLIMLSIGYSACHWCHVMAHESFEDETTAKYLNEHFLSIKIDREEYPDLDHYYQSVCSLISGRGGWPLTVFLTPEGKPFFAGTYFPKVARQGLPSFTDILKHVQNLFINEPEKLRENAEKIIEEVKKPFELEKKIDFKGHFPSPSAILNAMKNYADVANGGYGKAPKFPHFAFYEWACEQILEGMIPKEQGQHIVESIEKMMMGGMYDHAKGGIHRYSVDDKYMVPHFEKMLYDQAGLLKVLAKLSQFYPSPLIFDGVLQTLEYLQTEMVSDEKYYFSAQDADSEGQEGLYFTFTKEEFIASFENAPEEQKSKVEYFLNVFNITSEGNFEHGLNVLSLNFDFKNEYYTQEGWQEIREIRRRLLEARKLRVPPATDMKGIAGWNFMILSGLSDIVQYCPVDVIRNQAFALIQETVEGCLKKFIFTDSKSNRHLIRHSSTLEKQALYLEDYVNFSDAQLRLYEISGNEIFKNNALETIDYVTKNFIKDGELYLTSLTDATSGIENLTAPSFDQSYRSAVMTFIHLLSRATVFDMKFSPEEIFKEKYAHLAQLILTNPLGHGEGLRAYTYPVDIYRKVEVPFAWLENKDFLEMRSHFFSRFVVTYQTADKESYQICTRDTCEATGKGIDKFKELFNMKDPEDAK